MPTCPVCDRPTTPTVVGESAMAVGPVTVRLLGLPVRACDAGHRTVGDGVVDELAARTHRDAPAATTTMLRRRPRCAACEAELVLPPRRSDKPIPVPVADRVVTVRVEAPYARCTECGTEQLAAGIGHDRLDAAVAAAVDAALEPGTGQR